MTEETNGKKLDYAEDSVRVPIFGKSSLEDKLPCGFVDASGTVHNTVVLRQMTGYEEEMMMQDDVNVITRFTNILSACCEQLGTIRDKAKIRAAIADENLSKNELPLTSVDRVVMMLYLRIATVGKIYRAETICPHCGQNTPSNIDLRTLEIQAVKDPTKRLAKIKLPSGDIVVLKMQTGADEVAVVKVNAEKSQVKSLSILSRIVSVGDVHTPKDLKNGLHTVRKMTAADRAVLEKAIVMMEGSIDTDIEVECARQSCRKIYKFPLDLGQVFFSKRGEEIGPEQIEWM